MPVPIVKEPPIHQKQRIFSPLFGLIIPVILRLIGGKNGNNDPKNDNKKLVLNND
jgi:hypothetical protein